MKKLIALFLIGLITNVTVFAAGSVKNKQDDTAKVRAEIARLGTGSDAKVNIKLKSGKKIKGYVSETKADSFVVTDNKTGATTEVRYYDVKQAKGKNRSTGATAAIAIAGVIGGVLLIGLIFHQLGK